MKRKKSESKRVFFLGAGFTRDAGVPLQRQLLPGYLLRVESRGKRKVLNFLSDVYSFKYRKPKSLNENDDFNTYPILEDVFSMIDNATINREFLRDYRPRRLEKIREELVSGIIALFDQSVRRVDYVNRFARALTDWRLKSDSDDPFSIITTNWDIVLLNSLTVYHDQIIRKHFRKKRISNLYETAVEDRQELALVDFCLYSHFLDDEMNHVPSLKIKPMGFRNIKFLFLHGSPTLRYCRKCRRIFTLPSYGGISRETRPSKGSLMERKFCQFCGPSARPGKSKAMKESLSHILIMPTYLKVIQNVHLLDVWQNAAMELQEATEVYFIGYSLPEADYLIRDLLVSNIQSDARINLLDYCGRSSNNYRQLFGSQIEEDYVLDTRGENYVNDLSRQIEKGRIR
jgi:hypothetical protein